MIASRCHSGHFIATARTCILCQARARTRVFPLSKLRTCSASVPDGAGRARKHQSSMLSLALPPRPWGIMACIHRSRNATRSAMRVRRHTVFDNLAPLAEHSADILVPPCRQTAAQCGFSRSHRLVICAAKPRYTAAAAREHWRVLAPRLLTPSASVTSPLHTPRVRGAL